MGAEGVPEGPPLEDEPPDRAGDGECWSGGRRQHHYCSDATSLFGSRWCVS